MIIDTYRYQLKMSGVIAWKTLIEAGRTGAIQLTLANLQEFLREIMTKV